MELGSTKVNIFVSKPQNFDSFSAKKRCVEKKRERKKRRANEKSGFMTMEKWRREGEKKKKEIAFGNPPQVVSHEMVSKPGYYLHQKWSGGREWG